MAHFSGHSWISLPTLTHAYSDLQLSFEFKPEAEDGILLLTGETRDMTGDYLALLLREGHVELRYCSILVFTKHTEANTPFSSKKSIDLLFKHCEFCEN